MKVQVIEDWRGAHRLWSVIVALLGAISSAGAAAWLALDSSLREALPAWIPPTVAALVFFCTIIVRLIQQPVFQKPDKADGPAAPSE